MVQWTIRLITDKITGPNWIISAFVYAYAVVAFKQELRDEAIFVHRGRLPTKTNLSRLGKQPSEWEPAKKFSARLNR